MIKFCIIVVLKWIIKKCIEYIVRNVLNYYSFFFMFENNRKKIKNLIIFSLDNLLNINGIF